MLARLAGNHALKQDLSAALRAGRLPHSILLAGEPGCGAGFAARCLAADYLYPHGGPHAEAVLRGEDSECLTVRGEGARVTDALQDMNDLLGNTFKVRLVVELLHHGKFILYVPENEFVSPAQAVHGERGCIRDFGFGACIDQRKADNAFKCTAPERQFPVRFAVFHEFFLFSECFELIFPEKRHDLLQFADVMIGIGSYRRRKPSFWS